MFCEESLGKINKCDLELFQNRPGARFLESPVNFSGPKSNIQIEIKRIRGRVLASKLLHFVSLTDSFIMLDAKLLKPRSLLETETAYRAR